MVPAVIVEPIKLRIFVFLSRENVRPEILRLRPVCTLSALSVLVSIVCVVLALAPCALIEAMYDVINTALKHLFISTAFRYSLRAQGSTFHVA